MVNTDSIDYLDPESINGLNLYAYCGNNPVNYTDRSGHSPEWWQWVLSSMAVVSGIIFCASGIGGIAGGALIVAGCSVPSFLAASEALLNIMAITNFLIGVECSFVGGMAGNFIGGCQMKYY